MAALKHPLVEDRIIEGQGAPENNGCMHLSSSRLLLLNFKKFQYKKNLDCYTHIR